MYRTYEGDIIPRRAIIFTDEYNISGIDRPGTALLSRSPATFVLRNPPRLHRALNDAIPFAKARGIIEPSGLTPERIYDISIVSKIPITFARVMFAPAIFATIKELVEYYRKELGGHTVPRLLSRRSQVLGFPVFRIVLDPTGEMI